MLSSIDRGLKRLGAAAAMALLLAAAGPSLAQTLTCVPGASGALPVVDTGLPVVQIWTTAGAQVLDRVNYITACMRIRDGSAQPYQQGLFTGTIKIRGRGNSTWSMPKKGYRLKLDSAAAVLDMPAHKDWVLLANYADKTLLRNAVGMELSRRVDMPWTPRQRHAEVYLNDDYLGNYQIGEKIEVAPTRLAMTPLLATDIAQPNVSGGYLIEADFLEYMSVTDRYFDTTEGYHFVVQSPSASNLKPEQFNYISQYTQAIETAIYAGNKSPGTGYDSLIDLDSMINWYLVEEVMKNVDSVFASSVNLYKDRNAKMKMGPLWDFDLGAGNVDYEPLAMGPTGWYVQAQAAWFEALFKDRDFRKRVKARWAVVKPRMQGIDAYIVEQQARLDRSQVENFKRWPILNESVWPNPVVLGSYPAEVSYLRDWLRRRIAWMDKAIAKY